MSFVGWRPCEGAFFRSSRRGESSRRSRANLANIRARSTQLRLRPDAEHLPRHCKCSLHTVDSPSLRRPCLAEGPENIHSVTLIGILEDVERSGVRWRDGAEGSDGHTGAMYVCLRQEMCTWRALRTHAQLRFEHQLSFEKHQTVVCLIMFCSSLC